MYEISFFCLLQKYMTEIIKYICIELKNPQAAQKIADELLKATDRIQLFPYANSVYLPIGGLKHEYRKMSIGSYLMFYWVDEPDKSVTVAAVIYGAGEYEKLLR